MTGRKKLIGSHAKASVVFILLSGVTAVEARGQERATPAPNHLRAKYVGGSERQIQPGRIHMVFSSEGLQIEDKKKKHLTIPVGKIDAVESRNVRPAHAAVAGLQTGGEVARALATTSPADCGALAIVYMVYGFAPTVGISAIVYARDKYEVDLHWGTDPDEHEAKIRLSASQYTTFLAQLDETTGRQWDNLRAEEMDLRRKPETKLSVKLDHPAYVGGTGLTTGRYQIVWLEQGGGQANLIFVAGNRVDPRRIRAIVPAEIVGAAEPNAPEAVTYDIQDGSTRITAVNIAGQRIGVKGITSQAQEEPQ